MIDSEISTLQVIFSIRWHVDFQKAVWLFGNGCDLGEWKIEKAIRMQHHDEHNWVAIVRLPIGNNI